MTSLAWFCGILSLIAIWARDGKPKYAPKEASIVFVSNVAGKHKVGSEMGGGKLTIERVHPDGSHYCRVGNGSMESADC